MFSWLFVLVAFTCTPTTYLGIRIYSIPSQSMEPTLHVGSYIAVYRCAYGVSRATFDNLEIPIKGRVPDVLPARGDVVVFRLPRDRTTVYVKRVAGLPGDRIELENGRIVLNGEPQPRQAAETAPLGAEGPAFRESLAGSAAFTVLQSGNDLSPLRTMAPVTVPTGNLYVLGDNRDISLDSRMPEVGFVPVENLVGQVVATGYWLYPNIFAGK